MILYHGTNLDFAEIDLKKSKPNKDFGQGFYLSREYAQAMDIAKAGWALNSPPGSRNGTSTISPGLSFVIAISPIL